MDTRAPPWCSVSPRHYAAGAVGDQSADDWWQLRYTAVEVETRMGTTRRVRSKILDRANRAARDGNAVIVAAFGTTDGLGWAMVKLTADEYRELVEAAPPDEGPVCFRVRVDGGLSPWLWTTGRQLRSSSRPSAGRLASEVKRA